MADGNGYIKLYRSILSWEWYQDVPTFVVFLHLLLTANYEDKHWKGTLIRRGETVTSYAKIAEDTGVSYQQARNAVNKLKSTGEITQFSTSRYSLIHTSPELSKVGESLLRSLKGFTHKNNH